MSTQPDANLTLILGGTRSGKSAVAERWATAAAIGAPVTYVATAAPRPDDADHGARIAAHRARRPANWVTVECPEPGQLADAVTNHAGPLLVDSLGTWVANHWGADADAEPSPIDPAALVAALVGRSGPTWVVSEEVGWSVHPPTAAGRRFVDDLGRVNQAVSVAANRAVLVVAGRVLDLWPC